MKSRRPSTRILTALVVALFASTACAEPDVEEASAASDDEYADRMAVEHADDTTEPSPATEGAPAQATGLNVVYATVDGEDVSGYLVPGSMVPGAGEGTGGAVIVIHEWWGLNDNVRTMAEKLGALGYHALAVDLYEGRSADEPGGARELATWASSNEGRVEDNLRQAYRYLEDEVGAERIGSIGWCFGGGWSLRTALLFPEDLDATVIYYGRLVDDRERLASLDVPILGLFGAEDGGIPVDGVRAFEATLEELDKDVEIHVYDGAGHAFANPSGERYQAEAAEQAWGETTEFLARHLGGT